MSTPKLTLSFLSLSLLSLTLSPALAKEEPGAPTPAQPYTIVDTGQKHCYDAMREIAYPAKQKAYSGQDAQFVGNTATYRDLKDGTILDLMTGLMWQKSPGKKQTLKQAAAGAPACRTAGHRDWRLPSIKELYSLILFSGVDVDPQSRETEGLQPFIDTRYFDFSYGDTSRGERIIDSQWATSTKYVSTTMHGDETMFGVNFADGRIKGYGVRSPRRDRGDKTFYCIYVRGNPAYGKNDFHDNGDHTITDRATGLTWMKTDSGHLGAGPKKDGGMNWQQALAFAEELEYAGHTDWRLPNVKELQSLVDYTRSPDTTQSAAIDPIFHVSKIENQAGKADFPSYWSSTTHVGRTASAAAYVAFGRSNGWMSGRGGSDDHKLLDVHGAGSQRSDPKDGDPGAFPRGRGPQGDVIRIYNHVRLVRGGKATPRVKGPALSVSDSGGSRPRRGGDEQPPKGGGEPHPRPSGSAEFVRRFDRDGDGKVSKQEFRGPARRFERLDRNSDGYITGDEAPDGPPPGRGPGGPGR